MKFITTKISSHRNPRTLGISGYIQAANARVNVNFDYDRHKRSFELREYSSRITQADMRISVQSHLKQTKDSEQKGYSIYF